MFNYYLPCITSSFTLLYHEIVYTFESLNVKNFYYTFGSLTYFFVHLFAVK